MCDRSGRGYQYRNLNLCYMLPLARSFCTHFALNTSRRKSNASPARCVEGAMHTNQTGGYFYAKKHMRDEMQLAMFHFCIAYSNVAKHGFLSCCTSDKHKAGDGEHPLSTDHERASRKHLPLVTAALESGSSCSRQRQFKKPPMSELSMSTPAP